MQQRDFRSILFIFGLSVALLAGDFRAPVGSFDVSVRAALLLLLAIFAMLVPPKRNAGTPLGPVAVPFFVWIAWLGISALWSPNPVTSGVVADLLWMALALALTIHLVKVADRRTLDLLWWFWLAAGLSYFVLASLSGVDGQGRLTLPAGGPNVFVRVLALGVISAVFLAYQRRAFWPWPLAFALGIGALLSGSRGGVLGLAVIAVLAFLPLLRVVRGGTLVLVGTFGGGLGVVGWRVFRDSAPVSSVVEFVNSRFVEDTLVEGYTAGRDQITPLALDIFRDHAAFGAGLDAWQVLQPTSFVHPHNLYLSTAVDGGLVGAALLTVALLLPLHRAVVSRPLAAGTWAALAAALLIFISAMFSGYYYDSRLLWFFLILAVAYSHAGAPRSHERTQDDRSLSAVAY